MDRSIHAPGATLGASNTVLAGVAARYHVPDVEGCLSIKTVLHGEAVWQAGGRTFPMVEDQYLILNDRRRYTITIDSVRRVRTFCLFFARGFVEDVHRATVTDTAALLDAPASQHSVGFFEKLEMGTDAVAQGIGRLRGAVDSGMSREGIDEHFRAVAEALVWQHQHTASAVARVPAIRASTRLELYRRLLRGRDFLLSSLGAGARLADAADAACLSPYHFHRAFHRVPFLWGFHAVHHSAKSMDWLAAARMHFLEIIALRGTPVIPMFILGFAELPLHLYILIVYVHSALLHANVRWEFNRIGKFLATPRFHHWHHGLEKEAIDVNFAIHFPLLDRLFGTYHLPPGQWPSGYGIEGHPVPRSYLRQFLYPFARRQS